MIKYKVLGIVNIFLALLFGFIVFNILKDNQIRDILYTGILVASFFIFSLFINIFLVIKLLFNKIFKLPFYLYIFLTFFPIYLLALFFLTSFYASSILFHLFNVVLAVLVFRFLQKSSTLVSIMFLIITLFVVMVATINEFEESYCWEKGEQVERLGSEMIIATKEDEELLKAYLGGVKEGNKISAGFRAHILCHKTYSFNDAIRDILTTFPN